MHTDDCEYTHNRIRPLSLLQAVTSNRILLLAYNMRPADRRVWRLQLGGEIWLISRFIWSSLERRYSKSLCRDRNIKALTANRSPITDELPAFGNDGANRRSISKRQAVAEYPTIQLVIGWLTLHPYL